MPIPASASKSFTHLGMFCNVKLKDFRSVHEEVVPAADVSALLLALNSTACSTRFPAYHRYKQSGCQPPIHQFHRRKGQCKAMQPAREPSGGRCSARITEDGACVLIAPVHILTVRFHP